MTEVIAGSAVRLTRLDSTGQPIGSSFADLSGSVTVEEVPEGDEAMGVETWQPLGEFSYSYELNFRQVDMVPALLALLTGITEDEAWDIWCPHIERGEN